MHQARLEKKVQLEMFVAEQLQRQGRPISYENVRQEVKRMADALDNLRDSPEGTISGWCRGCRGLGAEGWLASPEVVLC